MEDIFKKYIKAVGTGPKHNYDLTKEQMMEAMDMILTKQAYPEQISAFLLGWRLKPETIEEFFGVLKSFDNYIQRVTIKDSIELGYPYDGKRNNPYLFSLMAKELQPYDLNIVVSGDKLQAGKNGVTVKDIFNNITKTKNLHFFDRADIFKEISNLTDIRRKLGIRTGLNVAERLINPANSLYAVTGVFHKPFMQKYAQIFGDRYKKLVIIKGNEGTQEIYSKCQYWVIENGNTTLHTIDPKDFGINYTKSWDKISLKESLDILNNPSDELIKIAKLNSAMMLYISNKTKSVKEAYELLS